MERQQLGGMEGPRPIRLGGGMECGQSEEDIDGGAIIARIRGVDPKQRARILLCFAHLFSELSEWIWQFSTVVWLTSLGEDGGGGGGVSDLGSSLFLVSSYQATTQICVILLVRSITKHVGQEHAASSSPFGGRKRFVSSTILLQIPCILLATILFGKEMRNLDWEMSDKDIEGDDDAASTQSTSSTMSHAAAVATLIAIYICGGLVQVLQKSYEISIERDWIVAIADDAKDGSDDRWLEVTNVVLKQIHLVCVIVGPSIAVLLHGRNDASSVLWVSGIKLTSLVLIRFLVGKIYRTIPSLRGKDDPNEPVWQDDADESDWQEEESDEEAISSPERRASRPSCGFVDNLRVYFAQEARWAGVALAFLYCNVMTFGGMLVAYLKSLGMNWTVIGICQGTSNGSGLVGTLAFAASQRYLDVRTTATWGICWQFLFLTMSISGVLVHRGDELLAARLVIAGVICSRVGLYSFDLACTQLYQLTVPSEERGQVGGTQTTLNSLFELVPFVLGMIFSDADKTYWIVMLVSYLSVGTAAALVILGVRRRRGGDAPETVWRQPPDGVLT